jgi:hypothetical protein
LPAQKTPQVNIQKTIEGPAVDKDDDKKKKEKQDKYKVKF